MTQNIGLNLICDSYQNLFSNFVVIEKILYGLIKGTQSSEKKSEKIVHIGPYWWNFKSKRKRIYSYNECAI